MTKDEDKQTSIDGKLDEVIRQLQDEPIPEMPSELLEVAPASESKISISGTSAVGSKTLIWFAAMAALILAMVFVARQWNQPDVVDKTNPNKTSVIKAVEDLPPDEVLTESLADYRPYENLEQELALIRSEIAQLKEEAKQLDAIRKVNALMAQN